MIIADLKAALNKIECDVPKDGNKCTDCINKAFCNLTLKLLIKEIFDIKYK